MSGGGGAGGRLSHTHCSSEGFSPGWLPLRWVRFAFRGEVSCTCITCLPAGFSPVAFRGSCPRELCWPGCRGVGPVLSPQAWCSEGPKLGSMLWCHSLEILSLNVCLVSEGKEDSPCCAWAEGVLGLPAPHVHAQQSWPRGAQFPRLHSPWESAQSEHEGGSVGHPQICHFACELVILS